MAFRDSLSFCFNIKPVFNPGSMDLGVCKVLSSLVSTGWSIKPKPQTEIQQLWTEIISDFPEPEQTVTGGGGGGATVKNNLSDLLSFFNIFIQTLQDCRSTTQNPFSFRTTGFIALGLAIRTFVKSHSPHLH